MEDARGEAIAMTWYAACLGGLAGAAAIEISELYNAIRSSKGFPWKRPGEAPLFPYLISVVLRLILGAVTAWLCSTAAPLGTPGAVLAGIAAPKLLEEFGRRSPLVAHSSLAAAQIVASSAESPQAHTTPDSEMPVVPREGGPSDAPR